MKLELSDLEIKMQDAPSVVLTNCLSIEIFYKMHTMQYSAHLTLKSLCLHESESQTLLRVLHFMRQVGDPLKLTQ